LAGPGATVSLINIVMPSPPGTTAGIGTILKLMRDNRDSLLKVVQLYRKHPESSSTFIAFFRELNSIYQITAVLNVWGTSFGYNGEGPRAYGAIRSAIEDWELPFEQHEWLEFSHQKTGWNHQDWSDVDFLSLEYANKWEELLIDRCYSSLTQLLPSEPYTFDQFNDNWKNRWQSRLLRNS
jgi:hypothetical protein